METGLHFPFSGTLYDMAVYAVTSLFWTVPTWFAAQRLGVSRWWTLAGFLWPGLLVLLLWHFAMPPAWRPGDDEPKGELDK